MAPITQWKGGNFILNWCQREHGLNYCDAVVSLCLPCITFASIREKKDPNECCFGNFMLYALFQTFGCSCCLTAYTRSHLNETENCCCNILKSWACEPCAMIETLKSLEPDDSTGLQNVGNEEMSLLADPYSYNSMPPGHM